MFKIKGFPVDFKFNMADIKIPRYVFDGLYIFLRSLVGTQDVQYAYAADLNEENWKNEVGKKTFKLSKKYTQSTGLK